MIFGAFFVFSWDIADFAVVCGRARAQAVFLIIMHLVL